MTEQPEEEKPEEETEVRRRPFQYSLRSLLIFMLAAGVFFGWLGERIQEAEKQRAIVNWVESMGGTVNPRGYFQTVTSVNLYNTQVKDLSPLKDLPNLEWLFLYKTLVTDLSPLEDMVNLQVLDLSVTQVSKEEEQKLQKALPNCWITRKDAAVAVPYNPPPTP